MEIRYSKSALKALQSYDKPTRMRIRNKIDGLTLTPPVGDIKPLAGESGVYRLRVGKFRVKYEYACEGTICLGEVIKCANILQIIDIDSRGNIYN